MNHEFVFRSMEELLSWNMLKKKQLVIPAVHNLVITTTKSWEWDFGCVFTRPANWQEVSLSKVCRRSYDSIAGPALTPSRKQGPSQGFELRSN
jgi:hypothetical protein